MKRNYEGIVVLKLQGQEEGVEEMLSGITKELESKGAKMEQIDRVGRKEFTHENHAKQKHGYYVHLQFDAEPAVVNEVQATLKVDENIMLQHYRRRR